MADPNGAPRRVSMAYILGFSKNPYKDPKPPPQPRPPQSSSLNQMMTAPGGIVEWAASDGRKGSLKGPGKTRSRADKSTEEGKDKVTHKAAGGKKGEADDEPGGNPHSFTDEEDKKLLNWKNENGNAAWKICGELLARPHFQCKDRYKELQGKEGGQNDGSAEVTTSGASNNQQQGKGNNKQTNSAGDGNGVNPNGFTQEQDKKIIEWRTEHSKQNWDDFAKEIGKLPKQCADRFKAIKPKDWRPADAQNGGGKSDTKKNNKNKGKGNKNEDKPEATTAGTDAGGGNDLWGAFGDIPGEDDNKEESGGTGNDKTGGDAGNNSSWDTNNAGNTADTSGNNETSWGSGGWNNNDTGNADTSGNNGNKSSCNTKNAGNTADTSGNNATSWDSGNWGDTSGGNGNTSGNNGNHGWNNGAETNNSGGGNGDWTATTGGNDNSGGNATSGADAWGSGNGGGDTSADNNGNGGDNTWGGATGGEFGDNKGWGDTGSKKSASKKSASNAGEATGWGGTGGDGANDAAATDWNADSNQQNNDTSAGDQNAWGAGDTWGAAPAPAKTASKAGSKAHSHHTASHKSSHRHSTQNNTPTPIELEVKPDDVFSADDLRLVARILQQDYQMVWNRVSWRFKDKTGRTIAPEVFEKKITGRVEGKEGKEERRERRRK